MTERELELVNCIRKYEFVLINRKFLLALEDHEINNFARFNNVCSLNDNGYDIIINVGNEKLFFPFFHNLKKNTGIHSFLFLKNEIPELIYDIIMKENISINTLAYFEHVEKEWFNTKLSLEKFK